MKIVTGPRCDGGLSPRERQISAGGITWHFLEWGDHGPPLVLWHGITSNARGWWRVGPFLAGLGFHVWAPDLPGHGLSDESPNGYTVEATARLLDGWMAALGLAAPIVLGHSWGGINALVQATLPDAQIRPRALVLEDPVLLLAANGEQYLPSFTGGFGVHLDVMRAELAAANPRWHECDVWWKAEAWQHVRRSVIEGFFLQNAGINLVERLGQLAVPTQILVADPAQGGIWTDEHLALVQNVAASCVSLTLLPDSSHNIHRDSFMQFTMALGVFARQFLKSAP